MIVLAIHVRTAEHVKTSSVNTCPTVLGTLQTKTVILQVRPV